MKGKRRAYFYYVNHKGNLYVLDDALAAQINETKSIPRDKLPFGPTYLKDKKFLDFFFRRVKPNDDDSIKSIWPFLSVCGVERNYIISYSKSPVVFLSFDAERKSFIYGATLKQPFEPDKLVISNAGELYHPSPSNVGGLSLVKTDLAGEIFEQFKLAEDGTFYFNSGGSEYKVSQEKELKD